MIFYTSCPICQSNNLSDVFSVKDNSISGESFTLVKCNNCTQIFTQNVAEQNEIGKYYQSENYISHSNTQKGIINKLYHLVRKKTLSSKKNLVEKETNITKGNILDIGCGTGAFLHTMDKANWKISGLEPDEAARKKAKELYSILPDPSLKIFELSAESYDAITMWHVLEHVHQLNEYIVQLNKLLKIDGKIFIAVPNYTSYDAGYYKAYWAAYDVPRHLYHFSPKSMAILLEKHGLKIKKTMPMWYDSFYVSMLSEKYKNGKGNIFMAFLIGLISNFKALVKKENCSSIIYVIEKN